MKTGNCCKLKVLATIGFDTAENDEPSETSAKPATLGKLAAHLFLLVVRVGASNHVIRQEFHVDFVREDPRRTFLEVLEAGNIFGRKLVRVAACVLLHNSPASFTSWSRGYPPRPTAKMADK